MAFSDYLLCAVCNGKAIYDADWYDLVGACEVMALCESCAATHVLRAVHKDEALTVDALTATLAERTRERDAMRAVLQTLLGLVDAYGFGGAMPATVFEQAQDAKDKARTALSAKAGEGGPHE